MTETNWVGVTPDPPPRPVKVSCAQEGHEYVHIVTADGELLSIHCERCERSWAVVEK